MDLGLSALFLSLEEKFKLTSQQVLGKLFFSLVVITYLWIILRDKSFSKVSVRADKAVGAGKTSHMGEEARWEGEE